MNSIVNNPSHMHNTIPNFNRLVEYIRQCVREREMKKEQQYQRVKSYSTMAHYVQHIKRCMQENPLVGRALFQFYHTIKNYSLQHNRMNKKTTFASKRFFFNK